MAINKATRLRIIIDLLKDGDVGNETPYNLVDTASVPLTTKVVEAFRDAYPFETVDGNGDPRDPTNAELVTNALNQIRKYVREVVVSVRTTEAAETTRRTTRQTEETAADTELGTDEELV